MTMARLSGLFDSFDNLDQIDINSLTSWFKNPPAPNILENYLANKILYPGTLPQTETDMKIDLVILRQLLRMNGPKPGQTGSPLLGDNPFLNITLRKIIIPDKFLQYMPDLVSLAWAFIDGLLLNRQKHDIFDDFWTIVLTADSDETVGSVILPEFDNQGGILSLSLSGNTYRIKAGSLTRIPCIKPGCEISYQSGNGRILGKKTGVMEVSGGRLGLMIDGRMR